MKNKLLNAEQTKNVEAKIRAFEENTGCELVIAVAKESDPYPAAPFRFAMIVTIITSLIVTYFFDFHFDSLLVAGQLLLLLVLVPIGSISFFKKRMLVSSEVEREVNEKTVELFHGLCTTKTQHQVSTFIYFTLLEKQIRLLVDKDINDKIEQKQLDDIVNSLAAEIKGKDFEQAIIHCIDNVESLVLTALDGKVNQVAPDEIKNQIVWIS